MIPMTREEFIKRFEREVIPKINEFEDYLDIKNVVNVNETFKQIRTKLIEAGILPKEAKDWELFRH